MLSITRTPATHILCYYHLIKAHDEADAECTTSQRGAPGDGTPTHTRTHTRRSTTGTRRRTFTNHGWAQRTAAASSTKRRNSSVNKLLTAVRRKTINLPDNHTSSHRF